MYLSKITLQPTAQASAELAKIITNGAYSSHQLLWRLFTKDTKRNFIYREEQDIAGRPVFYVLSKSEPMAFENIFSVQTKIFNPVLKQKQRLAYKLRVNPTVCVTNAQGKSVRHDVLMHAKKHMKNISTDKTEATFLMHSAAQNWLTDPQRLDIWGIELDAVPEIISYNQHKSKKKDGHFIQFSSVDFEGLLTIVDPERFLLQYQLGFGRAKSMGCGLMLIRPI